MSDHIRAWLGKSLADALYKYIEAGVKELEARTQLHYAETHQLRIDIEKEQAQERAEQQQQQQKENSKGFHG